MICKLAGACGTYSSEVVNLNHARTIDFFSVLFDREFQAATEANTDELRDRDTPIVPILVTSRNAPLGPCFVVLPIGKAAHTFPGSTLGHHFGSALSSGARLSFNLRCQRIAAVAAVGAVKELDPTSNRGYVRIATGPLQTLPHRLNIWQPPQASRASHCGAPCTMNAYGWNAGHQR